MSIKHQKNTKKFQRSPALDKNYNLRTVSISTNANLKDVSKYISFNRHYGIGRKIKSCRNIKSLKIVFILNTLFKCFPGRIEINIYIRLIAQNALDGTAEHATFQYAAHSATLKNRLYLQPCIIAVTSQR